MDYLVENLKQYVPVLVGLVVGTLTHFAGPVADGRKLAWNQVVGYIMRLAFIGLLAIVVINFINIESNEVIILITSIFSISAQEIVSYVKNRGWKLVVQTASGVQLDEPKKKPAPGDGKVEVHIHNDRRSDRDDPDDGVQP